MFRVVYIDDNNKINHKGGFNSDAEAYKWIDAHKEVTPVRLLIWSDELDCFDTFKKF